MKSSGTGHSKKCKIFHSWSGWTNMGGESNVEFRQCNTCGYHQARTRK